MSTWRRSFISLVLFALIVPPLIFSAWAWITLHYVYARGERAGYVQKISRKGWLCKTWEGELAMVNLPGAMPEIFHFSVAVPAVAQEVERLVGQRVSLTYEQHKGVPSACFGETEYFIVRISAVEDSNRSPAPARTVPASPASIIQP